MSHTIFSSLSTLSIIPGTTTIIAIVFVVQILEHILDKLTELTNDTPFEGMVSIFQRFYAFYNFIFSFQFTRSAVFKKNLPLLVVLHSFSRLSSIRQYSFQRIGLLH